jgi:hypothetical protein
MSLRTVHLVFILVAMIMADMFGAWTIWSYPVTHNGLTLALGIFTLVGGLALAVYAIFFVRSLDRAHIT